MVISLFPFSASPVQTSERQIQRKETGLVHQDADDEILYKIDVPANR